MNLSESIFDFSELENQIESLFKFKILPEKNLRVLCEKAKEIISREDNILKVNAPVTVCGDIHGHFEELIELFAIGGKPPETNYLFLGNYVNKGHYSVETITLLIALKIRYPSRIFLLRGNNESIQITQIYGLYDECLTKYGNQNIWNLFVDLFNYFPLVAIIENQFFCVHSGLSPSIDKLDQIREIQRFQDVPIEGPICDLLWINPESDRFDWGVLPKGMGYYFGSNITQNFLFNNKLSLILRSHQLIKQGYEWIHNNKLCTLFSAPNYCNRCGNLAAIMEFNEYSEFNMFVII